MTGRNLNAHPAADGAPAADAAQSSPQNTRIEVHTLRLAPARAAELIRQIDGRSSCRMRHELGPAQVFLNENGAVVHCGLLRGLEVIFIRRQCSTLGREQHLPATLGFLLFLGCPNVVLVSTISVDIKRKSTSILLNQDSRLGSWVRMIIGPSNTGGGQNRDF